MRAPESRITLPKEQASRLPTLQPGLDTLPKRCTQCGSAWLDMEPSMAGARFGVLSCRTCGSSLAWLHEPLRRARRVSAPANETPTRTARADDAAAVGAPWRRLSCSTDCRAEKVFVVTGAVSEKRIDWRVYHDVVAHDAYAQRLALALNGIIVRAGMVAERVRTGPDIVKTGVLLVNRTTTRTYVDGAEVGLSKAEYALLDALCMRPGQLMPRTEIAEWVWPSRRTRVKKLSPRIADPEHVISVLLSRLRSKLGAAGDLIESLPGRGLVLNLKPVVTSEAS